MQTMLKNMWYKACTQADIKLLQSKKRFRNVSIMTAYNSYRDRINELGAECFTKETGQQLVTFYSVDRWKSEDLTKTKHRKTKKTIDPVRSTNVISVLLQERLWNLPPSCTKHHPGKLTVYIADSDKQSLDTLFVKLTAPPFSIQLEGLPENVVPIMHQAQDVTCTMPDRTHLSISRD
ncbi:hypothetical protein B0H21DRAFT_777155 [Amylocystis lapponica]|nr:hypothetical protein B0H21DRAFT_777155 [Amylocystis lapponica]